MVLRILFRVKPKKYPQNTFRVHKRIGFHLCTLSRALFSYCFLSGQFIQSATAPEQFNVEHQFITGGNIQFLIDAVVVLFYGMNADKGQVRNVRSFVAFNVIIQYAPLCRRKCLDLFYKTMKQIFHAGWQRSGIDLPGIQLGEHLHTDHRAAGLHDAVVPKHTVDQQQITSVTT